MNKEQGLYDGKCAEKHEQKMRRKDIQGELREKKKKKKNIVVKRKRKVDLCDQSMIIIFFS